MNDVVKVTEQELRKQNRRVQRNLRHAHAKGLMQGILSMLQPGDVVLDCGANIGDVCVPLAETGAIVHAFEPDPYAIGQIAERVKKLPNVKLHQAAVGKTAGTIQLMRAANFDNNPQGGSVKSTVIKGGRNIDEDADNMIDVELVSLPDIIRDLVKTHGRIAFLKMDIEGAELELLELMLAENLFENIGLTVAETHERKFADLRPRFLALREAVGKKHPITKVNLDWI